MKNSYFIILAVAVIVLAGCRKERIGPNYPIVQQYTYVDEYDDNRNGWNFTDDYYIANGTIYGGTYKVSYLDDLMPDYFVTQNVGFNYRDNFTIQTRMGSDNAIGLIFGRNPSTNSYGYSFMIDYDGNYGLYDEGGNGYGDNVETLASGTKKSFINGKGDWNEVKVEQQGNTWYGYINNVNVFTIDAQKVMGSDVGYIVLSNTRGEADYIQVDWLE